VTWRRAGHRSRSLCPSEERSRSRQARERSEGLEVGLAHRKATRGHKEVCGALGLCLGALALAKDTCNEGLGDVIEVREAELRLNEADGGERMTKRAAA